MAWKDLSSELSEMFGALENTERVSLSGLRRTAGSLAQKREMREHDSLVVETRAQRTHRRRLERARRVEGLVRGQHYKDKKS